MKKEAGQATGSKLGNEWRRRRSREEKEDAQEALRGGGWRLHICHRYTCNQGVYRKVSIGVQLQIWWGETPPFLHLPAHCPARRKIHLPEKGACRKKKGIWALPTGFPEHFWEYSSSHSLGRGRRELQDERSIGRVEEEPGKKRNGACRKDWKEFLSLFTWKKEGRPFSARLLLHVIFT